MPLHQYKNGTTSFKAPTGDPIKPDDGEGVLWVSDGTGLGNAGDLIFASSISSTVKYTILSQHSAGATWS